MSADQLNRGDNALLETYTKRGQSLLDQATGDVKDHLSRLFAMMPTIAAEKGSDVVESWLNGIVTQMQLKKNLAEQLTNIDALLSGCDQQIQTDIGRNHIEKARERSTVLRDTFKKEISDEIDINKIVWHLERLAGDLTELEKKIHEILVLDQIDQNIDMRKLSSVVGENGFDYWNNADQNTSALSRISILKRAEGLPLEIQAQFKKLEDATTTFSNRVRSKSVALLDSDGPWTGDLSDLDTAATFINTTNDTVELEKLEHEILNSCVEWINSLS